MGFLQTLTNRLTRRRTPIPPKPYKDTFKPVDVWQQRFGHMVNPEAPHYTDPRFESRGKIPWFDIFGMNRDWSMTIAKLGGVVVLVLMFQEYRLVRYGGGEKALKMRGGPISAMPTYSVDKEENAKKTRAELEAEGYTFLGTRSLDFIEEQKEEREERKKSML